MIKQNLDSLKMMNTIDTQNMRGSIELLSAQVEEVAKIAESVKVPAHYAKAKQIVVMGMGGSALGAHVIRAVFEKYLKAPLEVVNGYHIPAYVGKDTVVVLSSYSGTTEEVLSAYKEAKKKTKKLLIISAKGNGALEKEAKKNKIPALVFTTENNPCNQPRMGLGYSVVGQVLLFGRAGLISVNDRFVKKLITTFAAYSQRFAATVPLKENAAKQIAAETFGKTAWYLAAEHLLGNAHVAANQMNENAKRFGGYHAIPELNHHLMEGLVKPDGLKDNVLFILLTSKLYDKAVEKRFEVTKDVLTKHAMKYVSYECVEKDVVGQMAEMLVLGSYVSFYSAILEGVDPSPIPVVDYFKNQLKK